MCGFMTLHMVYVFIVVILWPCSAYFESHWLLWATTLNTAVWDTRFCTGKRSTSRASHSPSIMFYDKWHFGLAVVFQAFAFEAIIQTGPTQDGTKSSERQRWVSSRRGSSSNIGGGNLTDLSQQRGGAGPWKEKHLWQWLTKKAFYQVHCTSDTIREWADKVSTHPEKGKERITATEATLSHQLSRSNDSSTRATSWPQLPVKTSWTNFIDKRDGGWKFRLYCRGRSSRDRLLNRMSDRMCLHTQHNNAEAHPVSKIQGPPKCATPAGEPWKVTRRETAGSHSLGSSANHAEVKEKR